MKRETSLKSSWRVIIVGGGFGGLRAAQALKSDLFDVLDSETWPPAIVVTVLWFIAFSQVRSSFAGLFVAKKAGLKSSSPAELQTTQMAMRPKRATRGQLRFR